MQYIEWERYRKLLTKNQHGIVDEPALSVPRRIGRVSVTRNNHNHPGQSDISTVRLEPAAVREGTSIKSLRIYRPIKENVGGGHYNICNHASSSNEVDEPVQNHRRAAAALQESKARKDHSNGEGKTRDSGHGTLFEAECQDFGRAAFESHAVQASRGSISVRVASAEDGRH